MRNVKVKPVLSLRFEIARFILTMRNVKNCRGAKGVVDEWVLS